MVHETTNDEGLCWSRLRSRLFWSGRARLDARLRWALLAIVAGSGACDSSESSTAAVACTTCADTLLEDVAARADAAAEEDAAPEVGLDAAPRRIDAGVDRVASSCETVTLTVGDAQGVTWRQTAGPLVRAFLTDTGLSFVAPVFTVPSRLEFEARLDGATDVVAVDVGPAVDPTLAPGLVKGCGRFPHGVASGDPTAESVLLWTRLEAVKPEPVSWIMARDPLLTDVVATGSVEALPENDYTVVVEVSDLDPGATWYYGFTSADGARSALGRTRTAPAGKVDRMRLATMSCSSLWSGYFNAYRRLSERDVDVVVHLGDFVYDFVDENEHVRLPPGQLPESPTDRASWRTRFREYLSDPDLRAARAAHPWIVIWDNHDADEADEAGQETTVVFREYVPMRLPDPVEPRRAWRSFEWGDLVDLVLLDSLLWRSEGDMLGAPQRTWLKDTLTQSTSAWRFVGNQKLMSTLTVGSSAGPFAEASPWDAYPATRAEVLDLFRQVGDVVAISGDLHFTIAHDLVLDPASYDPETGIGAVGAELLASGITRGNFDETLCNGECSGDSSALFTAISDELLAANPHAVHYELIDHGYGVVEVTPERVLATVWYSPIRGLADAETPGPTLEVARGANRWTRPLSTRP